MQTTEQEFSDLVLAILRDHPYGSATYRSIRKEIVKRYTLRREDMVPSMKRKGEQMWQQIVRNITSHHDVPGNHVYEGYLRRVKGGLEITPAGRKKIGS